MGTDRVLVIAGLALLVIAAMCGFSSVSASLAQGSGASTPVACGTALRDSDQYRTLQTGGSASTSSQPYVFMSAAQYQAVSTCRVGLLTMRIAAAAALVLGGACAATGLIRRQRAKRPQGE